MFYGQCNDCGERWELGTASTCKCPVEALAKPDFWEGYVPEPVKPATEESSATQAQQALDKKAENARELGLDYDVKSDHRLMEQPAQQGCMRCNTPKKCALYGCSPLTWPSEKPAQQEPVAWPAGLIERIKAAEQRIQDGHAPRRIPADPTDVDLVLAEVRYLLEGKQPPFWVSTPPPAQRTWVGLTDEEIEQSCVPLGAAMLSFTEVARAIEAKLKEKNT